MSSPTTAPPGEGRSPAKKSLFNRPSWARSSLSARSEANDGDESFSRSSYVIEKIKRDQAEISQRKKEKLDRRQDKRARRSSTEHTKSERNSKRKRAGGETDSEEEDYEIGLDSETCRPERSPAKSQLSNGSEIQASPSKEAVVIGVDDQDDSDDSVVVLQNIESKDLPGSQNQEYRDNAQYFSDEDLSDYTREERRRRRQKAELNTNAESSVDDNQANSSVKSTMNQSEPSADPVLKILVTSRMPNTNPLLVHRKASQRLKEVRQAWCQRQGFEEEMANSVFLTWRGRRVFDVTTCRSLGVKVDAFGDVVIKGGRHGTHRRHDEAEDDEAGAQMHMEAVTGEIFEQDMKQRDAERLHGGRSQEDDAVEPPAKAPGIRIILKANLSTYKDYKLQVKPTTTFRQIVHVYCSQRGVPHDRTVFLMFDGEKLDEGGTMQDSEVGDMDTIDVHVK